MLEWLWPSVCVGCDRTGAGLICAACAPDRVHVEPGGPEGVARVLWLTRYDQPLGRIVRRGKYVPDRGLVTRTGDRMGALARPWLRDTGGLVVPVPSTARSRLKRGFGTGALLGGRVASAAGLPLRHVLTLRDGPRQATRTRDERLANLRGRLRCDVDLAGHVWLVDDVLTTGATASACARELLSSGASRVSLLVACRVETA